MKISEGGPFKTLMYGVALCDMLGQSLCGGHINHCGEQMIIKTFDDDHAPIICKVIYHKRPSMAC